MIIRRSKRISKSHLILLMICWIASTGCCSLSKRHTWLETINICSIRWLSSITFTCFDTSVWWLWAICYRYRLLAFWKEVYTVVHIVFFFLLLVSLSFYSLLINKRAFKADTFAYFSHYLTKLTDVRDSRIYVFLQIM